MSNSMAPARSCSSRTICSILLKHAKPERQPGIDAGGPLANEAGAQHQLVGDDFGFLWVVAQQRQEVTAEAHEEPCSCLRAGRNRWAAIAYFGED